MPDGSAAATASARPTVARSRAIVSGVFFLAGFLFANWAPRIPEKRDALGIGEGALGLALLGMAIGALIAMRMTGRLADRFGARRLIGASAVATAVFFFALAFAPSPAALGLVLFLFGAANGALDVAMNVEGSAVEREAGRPIFSAFHGMFSLGAMAGAVTGGLAAEAGLPLAAHFAPLALLAVAAGLGAARLLPRREREAEAAEAEAPPAEAALARRRLLLLGLIAFGALMAEGAAADWSAILLVDYKGSEALGAGLAFAAFSATMALGRFLGDRAQARFGRPAIVRGGGALAALGYALAAGAPEPWLAGLGFALAGIGLSCLFPVTLAVAAAAAGPRAAGAAIAMVATFGYSGFLVGPPLIGFLAEGVGLPLALGVVAILMAFTPFGAAAAGPRR